MNIDKFIIKQNSTTAALGSFVASHCIPDSLVFLTMGIGCKAQLPIYMGTHETNNSYVSRMGWSEFDENDLITGSVEKVKSNLLGQINRFDGNFFPIVISPIQKLIGMDSALKKLADELSLISGKIIRFVEMSGVESDFWEGYWEVVKTFAKTIDWSNSKLEKKSVNIWGYPFDRYEKEHSSNIRVLREELARIGIKVNSIFLSGEKTHELSRARHSEYNLILPFASDMGQFLENLTGKKSIYTEMPMGISGTKKWLKRVSISIKSKKSYEKSLSYSNSREEELNQVLVDFKKKHSNQSAGIILDLPYITPILNIISELGINTKFIIIRDRHYGGIEMLKKNLEFHNINLDNLIITDSCTFDEINSLSNTTKVNLVIASSFETKMIKTDNTRLMEFGFPSTNTHFKDKEYPFLGFDGFKSFVKLVDNALNSKNNDNNNLRWY